MKARISGNYSDIEFGSDALDPDVPINEKELANREELIEVLILPVADRSKHSLTKLSDKELIMKARTSGNYSDIEFGSDALDPDVPINEKELANREELIEVLIEPVADRCPDSGASTSSA